MKKEKLRIIRMGRGHIPVLAPIYVRAYRTRGECWTIKRANALLNHYLDKQPDMAQIAEVNGVLVGAFLCLIKPWWDGAHMIETEVFVDTRCQQGGIAKVLFKALLMRSKDRYKAKTFGGMTFAKLDFPMSWYKRLGVKQAEELMFIEGNVSIMLRRLR